MPDEDGDFDPVRAGVHRQAIGRWENEGGSPSGWSHPDDNRTVVGDIGDAEAGNIRIRLIALENIVVALLAEATDSQLELVQEMAGYISPRPGSTPHRLTIEAARNMEAIVERAVHYRNCKAIDEERMVGEMRALRVLDQRVMFHQCW